MALIKCSECKKEISDKAASCPDCGNPMGTASHSQVVHVANVPGKTLKIEPELTSKTWKKVKLISGLIILSGFIVPAFMSGDLDGRHALGWTIVFIGALGFIVGKIGAWYADKRTR